MVTSANVWKSCGQSCKRQCVGVFSTLFFIMVQRKGIGLLPHLQESLRAIMTHAEWTRRYLLVLSK